jgi:hypothetical protein
VAVEAQMAKVTKAQAMALLEKKIGPMVEKGGKAIDAWEPKVKATTRRLADAIKSGESFELVKTQANVLRLYSGKLSEGTLEIDKALKVIMKMQDDPELLEALADTLTKEMKAATDMLEKARKALEDGKVQLDAAETAAAAHAGDSRQARQEWAEAVAEVDQLVADTSVEIKAWVKWEADCQAAVARRDRKELQRLLKTRPASTALDEVASRPAGMAFKEFDKEFDRNKLDAKLQAEIGKDRTNSITRWFGAQQAAKGKEAIVARAAGWKIEPRNVQKALDALGLPASVKVKLQAAIDLPDAEVGEAVAKLAKALKIDLKPKDAADKLKKAGVL